MGLFHHVWPWGTPWEGATAKLACSFLFTVLFHTEAGSSCYDQFISFCPYQLSLNFSSLSHILFNYSTIVSLVNSIIIHIYPIRFCSYNFFTRLMHLSYNPSPHWMHHSYKHFYRPSNHYLFQTGQPDRQIDFSPRF